MWQWGSGAQDQIASAPFYNTQVPAITSYWRALPSWQRLIADTASDLVTAGRGTHIAPIVSGGSGKYLLNDSDRYVTASRTPDGTLAVIYMSHPSTITIDESMMVPGYRATWVDPASGATRAATPGPTYSSASQGSNSVHDADWVLVLGAYTGGPSTPPPPGSVTYRSTAHLAPRSWAKGRTAAGLRARFRLTYAGCSACGGVHRPITIEGRLAHGSWRTITTQTYRGSNVLTVRVPYKFRQIRVRARALRRSTSTTYAAVVSNSVRVPKRPR
ncbi:hypothetical protein JCM18899A_45470 [Nocardioides sp. AN3]